jgi:hypothetical protein
MAIVVVTPPTAEPVSLEEAKAHLRIDGGDEDTYVASLIIAARDAAELFTRRRFMEQTLDLFLDRFPGRLCYLGEYARAIRNTPFTSEIYEIPIPVPPTQSVTSIKYTDPAGAMQTLDTAEYQVDVASEPARLRPAYGKPWPSTRQVMNAVQIRLVAGYAAGKVPGSIKAAILLTIGKLHENREDALLDNRAAEVELPNGAQSLLWPYRDLRA